MLRLVEPDDPEPVPPAKLPLLGAKLPVLNLPEPKELPVVPKPVLPRLLPKPPASEEPLLPKPPTPREPLLPKPPEKLLLKEPVPKLLKLPFEKVWLARGWVLKPELVNPEPLPVKLFVRLFPRRLLPVPETFRRLELTFEFTTVSPVVLLKLVLPASGSLNVLMLFALNCVEVVANGFAVLLEKLLNPVEGAEENDVTTIVSMGCLHRQPTNFLQQNFCLRRS